MNAGDFQTPEELSERWKVPLSWIYRQTMQRGPDAIPRVKIGKYLRFEPAAVDAWLRRQQEAHE